MKKVLNTVVVTLMIILLVACSNANYEQWKAQYDLGIKYLNEGNYEEAILAFNKAIEIDDKAAPGYVGRADAYMGLAKTCNDPEKASEYYNKAIIDYQKAVDLGDNSANDKKEKAKGYNLIAHESEKAKELLKPLYETLAGNDYEKAVSIMNQQQYKALGKTKAPYLIYGDGENKLVLYPDNHCYFGKFVSGEKTGDGIWIESEPTSKTKEKHVVWQMYDGLWSKDMPNGAGSITINLSAESQQQLFDTYPLKKEIKGEFKNGVYNGEINQIWYMESGDTYVWSPIVAKDGVYQKMDGETSSNGKYPISKATTNNGGSPTLSSDGSVQYVFGFEK